ncbi:MAG TPA: phage terminase large subunit [Anaerolineae bacterium]|nr:phage terminase large subunit [Anaerolineae bacterium]
MWKPNPGPQTRFMQSPAYEVLYGGAAGGGKSEALLVEALRHVAVPGYHAILFRRTFPELERSLIQRSQALYPGLGGVYRSQQRRWAFPSGATITFGHLEGENDQYKYQSAEFAFLGFDELTSFTEAQYLYLFSRARTTARQESGKPLPVRIRAATNPGGVGHAWVKARFIDPLPPFQIGYFIRENDVERRVAPRIAGALSRQFIPATIADNPVLMEVDSGYRERLMALPLIERERLLNGNWSIAPTGNVFKPEWFQLAQGDPTGLRWARYWDLATSVRTHADYTASARVALDADGVLYISALERFKAEWPETRRRILAVAAAEPGVQVGVEKTGFQLAAIQELRTLPELVGTSLLEVMPKGDKLARALSWSARAEAGKVRLVAGPWVGDFIQECVGFSGDGSTHDDQVDAVSGAVQMLAARAAIALGTHWQEPGPRTED